MSAPTELPGLERLMEVCRRLQLRMRTAPPGHQLPRAGAPIEGLPFDPMLAAVYSRLGQGAFATDVAGIILSRFDDEERKLERDNQWWSQGYRKSLALPTFIFAGEPLMAYHYATVPSLADDEGRQPVVWIDVYEEPYALPVASNVDRFFATYAGYLEALMALPKAREEGDTLLTFPWGVPALMGGDTQLVELLRSGSFSPIMKTTSTTPKWVSQVLSAARS
ncbi:hypothetical protein [Hyalangium gracile]|uniref:hypothetical protein n=1 Tax=Hyalangium gracile TaxID=394092 RepID=UPI001CCF193D|nr:hypothetical protein [Hyalangium gracile]